VRLYRGYCPAVSDNGAYDGSGKPTDVLDASGSGRGKGCLFVAKRELEVRSIIMSNVSGSDALVMVAVLPSSAAPQYIASAADNTRLTPWSGYPIPKNDQREWRKIITVGGGESLNITTNVAFLNISAITLDIAGVPV